MRAPLALLLVLAGLTLAACGGSSGSSGTNSSTTTTSAGRPINSVAPTKDKPKVVVPSGPAPTSLVVRDLRRGTGVAAQPGDTLSVQYVGVLYKGAKQFDASYDRGSAPFDFVLQARQVIPGWDQGLIGMKVGGRRELIIPARLAYGTKGQPPTIPPNSPLVFIIDLVKVR